ncbi:hypothetical protein EC957_004417 [Mortierella hygrophila]|uniref:Uncharacterized protein n=1 Tax=Mortierella hygrophila TaxID=979708 RepID=A0A9P6F2B2_9FUNG|nr:hypothetical protein EC957_004417 [Mortierella hygrophila]
MIPKLRLKEDFDIVFADPLDADKLLKLVLSKEGGDRNSTELTPQPAPLPESLGAKSPINSTWNLDMLVISEVAAAAATVVDLDRQLTIEQQLQSQSTESATLAPNRN